MGTLTLGNAKTKALKLIDEYSINGKVTSENKNSDYLFKMNDFADIVQRELANFIRIPATQTIIQDDPDATDYNSKTAYIMPDDFMQLNRIVLENTNSFIYNNIQNYYFEAPKTLRISSMYVGTIRVEYYRYPSKISEDTPDNYVFEVSDDLANLIPYYLAWAVKVQEDGSLASQFRRTYEVGLSNIQEPKSQGIQTVENIYNW